MFLHNTGQPLDVLLSFSHYDLQNATFAAYYPVLTGRAQIKRVWTASPFSMGLLTPRPPPWHPAPPDLVCAVDSAKAWAAQCAWPEGLPNLALGFSMRRDEVEAIPEWKEVPLVVGFSSPKEIHEAVAVWREVRLGSNDERGAKRKGAEVAVRKLFADAGLEDSSWNHGKD